MSDAMTDEFGDPIFTSIVIARDYDAGGDVTIWHHRGETFTRVVYTLGIMSKVPREPVQ